MNTLWSLFNLLAFTQFVACRDFYLGMFKRNDFLVAQDVIYKAPAPFGYTTASYGRLFKCPITYFRVVDRLGQGRGPFTTIVRGGLRKKYISVRIKSTYRLPVSVNIYVGCENKQPSTFRSTTRILTTTPISTDAASGSADASEDGLSDSTTPAGEDGADDSSDATTDSDAFTPGADEDAGATSAVGGDSATDTIDGTEADAAAGADTADEASTISDGGGEEDNAGDRK